MTNNCGKYTTDGPQEVIVCLRQTNETMASPCVCVACYNKQAVSDKQIGGHLQFMAFRHGMRLIQEPPRRCCDLDSSIDIGAVPSFHSTAGFGFLSRIRSFKHSTC